MIPAHIIEKAIEGGWNWRTAFGVSNNLDINIGGPKLASTMWHQTVLDPLFWQSLGKALGWPKYGLCDSEGERISDPEWRHQAHRFYDLILTGGDTEKFWEEICPKV